MKYLEPNRHHVLAPQQKESAGKSESLWAVTSFGVKTSKILAIAKAFLAGLSLLPGVGIASADEVPLARDTLLANLARTTEIVQGEGIVVAANAVDISNAITSIVREIHFEPEQFVRAGDILYTLDRVEFDLAQEAAEAETLRASAQLVLARSAFERAKKLAESGTVSDVVLEEAQATLQIAEAELALARVRLGVAQVNAGYTTIVAPIDGIVGPSLVSVGAFVEAEEGDPLTRIVQLNPILVAYKEPYNEQLEILGDSLSGPAEDLLDLLTIKVQITDDLEYPIASKPNRLSGTVDPSTGEITLWAEFENPNYILRPGMRVGITTELDRNR